MKILFISKESNGGDMALRLGLEGNEVRYHIVEKDMKNLDGLITKETNWRAGVKWADLVVFDDTGLDEMTSWVLKTGKPAFGMGHSSKSFKVHGKSFEGHSFAGNLEKNRNMSQEVMSEFKVGEEIESLTFSSIPEALKHLKDHKVAHVIKPEIHGSGSEKTYVGEKEDNADAIGWLETLPQRPGGGKVKNIEIEERVQGVEVACSAWFNGKKFIGPVNINFEHKKICAGDIGFNTGEMGCYDAETEVLTSGGWKFWPQVTSQDKIATLKEGYLYFEYPKSVVRYEVDTELIGWKNRSLDILVTKNHNMYVQGQSSSRTGKDQYKFIQAVNLTESQYTVKRTSKWIGEDSKYFVLPARKHRQGFGFTTKPEIKIPMGDWAEFLGVYIAEGSAGNGSITIAQSHPEKSKKVDEIVSRLPFKIRRFKNGFTVCSRQLYDALKHFGRSYEKRVPSYIKDASPEIITQFLNGYAIGDGHHYKNGYRVFYSSNYELIGDVQELLIKIGRNANIKARTDKEIGHKSKLGNRFIVKRRQAYEACERVSKKESWIDKRDRYTKKYKGFVYCAEVESHVMLVRRNGKAFFCGNTLMFYDKRPFSHVKLFNETLYRLGGFLSRFDYRGKIDINCIVNKDGIWPLEFTPRLGYPSSYIECELQQTPFGELFNAIGSGQDIDNRVSFDWAMGVVLVGEGYPFWDEGHKRMDGMPIIGFTESNFQHLHPYDVAFDGKRLLATGCYPLTSTSHGKTVKECQDRIYKDLIPQIHFPGMYYRNDIGDKVVSNLEKLKSYGFDMGRTE